MAFPSDESFVDLSTTCSKEDAVARLLGWFNSPICHSILQVDEFGITLDQLSHMNTLSIPLEDQLGSLRKRAFAEFVSASTSEEEFYIDQILSIDEMIIEAQKIQYALDTEIRSHTDKSILQITWDTSVTPPTVTINIPSLHAWAKKVLFINSPDLIITPDNSLKKPISKSLRRDDLSKEIDDILEELDREYSMSVLLDFKGDLARKVMKALKIKADGEHDVIHEVKNNVISWGQGRKTDGDALKERVAEKRRKLKISRLRQAKTGLEQG